MPHMVSHILLYQIVQNLYCTVIEREECGDCGLLSQYKGVNFCCFVGCELSLPIKPKPYAVEQ